MSKTKLLPCPFCGGEAHMTTYMGEKTVVHYIECDGCKVVMGNPRPYHSAMKGNLYFESKEDAIKAWNTRKPIDDIVERLEDIIEPYTPNCNEYNRGVCDAIDIVRNAGKDGGE